MNCNFIGSNLSGSSVHFEASIYDCNTGRPFVQSGHMVSELIMLGRKLRSGTSKRKEIRAGLVRFHLFWKSHCVTCVPA